MENKFYEVSIKINPISPPPHINNYTDILPSIPSPIPAKLDMPNYSKRDSMIIKKKKSKCLCIRWC